jgi:hypothetical protein
MLGGGMSSRGLPARPGAGSSRSPGGQRDAHRTLVVIRRSVLVGAAGDEHPPIGEDGRSRRRSRRPEEADLRPGPGRRHGVVDIGARVGLPAVIALLEAARDKYTPVPEGHRRVVRSRSVEGRGRVQGVRNRVPPKGRRPVPAQAKGASVPKWHGRVEAAHVVEVAGRDPPAPACRRSDRGRRGRGRRGRGLGRGDCGGGRGGRRGSRREARRRRRRGRCRGHGRGRRGRARRRRDGRPAGGHEQAHDDRERTDCAETAAHSHPNTSGHRSPTIRPATNDAALAATATAMARRGSRPRKATA